jgi:CheY-like chemotaxis protein
MANKINPTLQVVILDDDKQIAEDLRGWFLKEGHPPENLQVYYTVPDFMAFLDSTADVHVAILDKNLGILNPVTMRETHVGDEVVPLLGKRFGPLIMVVITAHPDDNEEEELMDQGVKRVIKKAGIGAAALFPRILNTIERYQERILQTRRFFSNR